MTVLESDTFSRSNVASGWGTATNGHTWAAVRGTPTWSVSSNEGLYTAQGGGTFTIARLGSSTNGPQELLVRLKPSDTISNIGLVARYTATTDFYYGVLSGHPLIGKNTSGTFTTLGTDTSTTYTTANFYWLRFNLVGTTLKLRVWQDGNSEPGTWNVTVTDANHSSGGFCIGSDANSQSTYDHFQATDASTGVHLLICDGYGGVFS